MQHIAMECPACGARSQLDPAFAGGVCRCATCGEWMEVPDTQRRPLFRRQRVDRPDAPTLPAPAQPGSDARSSGDSGPNLIEAASSSPTPPPGPAQLPPDTLRLVIMNGPEAGTQFDLAAGKGCRVGRHTERRVGVRPSQLTLIDDSASRHHAMILWRGESWALADIGSRNGSYVNDRRVEVAVELRNGDVIRIGETSLAVRIRA